MFLKGIIQYSGGIVQRDGLAKLFEFGSFFDRRPPGATPRTVRGLGRLGLNLRLKCAICGHAACRSCFDLVAAYGSRKRLNAIKPKCGECGSRMVVQELIPEPTHDHRHSYA